MPSFRFPNKRSKSDEDEQVVTGGLWEEDLPDVEPPFVAQLKKSKGGPYYLTPDSAEPLPSGMYSKLDPDRVQRGVGTDDSPPRRRVRQMGVVQPALRESLEAEGPLGRRMIEALEGPRPQNTRVSPSRRPK